MMAGSTPTSSETSPEFVRLLPGDPVPWFRQRSFGNPSYAFDTVAGRYVVLCFFGSAGDAAGRRAIDAVLANRDHFDDRRACFFGVSIDPGDEAEGRIRDSIPGLRFFLDFDGMVSRLYGSLAAGGDAGRQGPVRRFWLVLDPTLRVKAVFPFAADGSDAAAVFACLERLPPPERWLGFEIQAPVLIIPDVFEPEFCRQLVELYDRYGGEESGFMREVDGKTVAAFDHSHKRRRDFVIEDQDVIRATQQRIIRRVVPEISKVHNFTVSRMERYIVCCYEAETGGHFGAHRDNTTKGTAHRRFAVSVNLNDAFEGGEISFPEYGPRSFKMPPGAAVVFSCSLLHSVSKVTSGRRYAFLPFLYDEAAAKLREANSAFLGDNVQGYKAAQT
jgi:predicted 2-oxoglutarate/Fe(II)-dependent dioxygenase YbiX/peroxiredoxin